MDHITITCDCGWIFRIKPKHAGLKTQCKTCQKVIAIPPAEVIANNLGREVTIAKLAKLRAGSQSTSGLAAKDQQAETSLPEMQSFAEQGKPTSNDKAAILEKLNRSGTKSLTQEELEVLKPDVIAWFIMATLKWLVVLMVLLPLIKAVGFFKWSWWWAMSPWLAAFAAIITLAVWNGIKSGKGPLRHFGCVFDLCNLSLMLILPALKLFGAITWSWWLVMIPWYLVFIRNMIMKATKPPATESDETPTT